MYNATQKSFQNVLLSGVKSVAVVFKTLVCCVLSCKNAAIRLHLFFVYAIIPLMKKGRLCYAISKLQKNEICLLFGLFYDVVGVLSAAASLYNL